MTVNLRPYQRDLQAAIYREWEIGKQNVLAVLPTGGGKTVVLSSILKQHTGAAVAIAHRQELVGQMALSLNAFGLRHRIVGPDSLRKTIIGLQLRKHGRSFYDATAPLGVAGVDTVIRLDSARNAARYGAWARQVSQWITDEGHHLTAANKWGRATLMFPNAKRGLAVTASPIRGDGAGLGRHADGLMDSLVEGPPPAKLTRMGYLTPYRACTVPFRNNHYAEIAPTASGDYSGASIERAEQDADIVGDIVRTYMQRTPGKKAVAFLASVAKSESVAAGFRAAGIPAKALSGDTPDDERAQAIQDLEEGRLLVLTNCDLFGEGFDLPAIEVAILGTKTASLGRFLQWCGRALRLFLTDAEAAGYDDLTDEQRRAVIAQSRKPYGLIHDHAGNFIDHGPPDQDHVWSLSRRERGASTASPPMPYRICANPGLTLNAPGSSWADFWAAGLTVRTVLESGLAIGGDIPCATPFPAVLVVCPHCGYERPPQNRTDPKEVEGDLYDLDPAALAALMAQHAEAHRTIEEYREYMSRSRVPHIAAVSNSKKHAARLEALAELADAMAWWGGYWRSRGDTDRELQRRFYFAFGIDVISAQCLSRADADALREKIQLTFRSISNSLPEHLLRTGT